MTSAARGKLPWVLFSIATLRAASLQAQAFEPPAIVWFAAPDYPGASLAAGIEAEVHASIAVDQRGAVRGVAIDAGAPAAFVEAVKVAVAALRLAPARAGGSAVSTNLDLTFWFLLQRRPAEEVVQPNSGEPPAKITGEVLAAGTRTPVAGVEVLSLGLGLGATTDARGAFSLQLPPGDHRLVVAAPEFRPVVERVTVAAGATATLDFRVYRAVPGGLEATVQGEARRQVAAAKNTVTREELRNVPGSQNDPLRVIENLPSVARAPFTGGQLIVRGARPIDTGAYYDGVRIPILYHLLNGPSVMAEEMVERIDFYAGGAGAYYGRQLAGIVEVLPRRSDVDRFHGSAAADLTKSSGFLQGPIGETRFAIGGRISYLNPLQEFLSDNRKPYQVPLYWDYQGRLERKLPDDSTFSLTAFGSGDSFAQINPARGNVDAYSDQRISFHRLQLRWEKKLTERLSLSLSPQLGLGDDVTATQGIGAGAFALPQRTADQSRSLGLRSQLTARFADWIEGHLGTDAVFERVAYQADRQIAQRIGVVQNGVNAERVQFAGIAHFGNIGGYVEAIHNFGPLKITPGLRIDAFHWTGHTHVTADPRLWARVQLTAATAFYAYAGLYHQGPEATEIDPRFGNPNLSPERAQQYGVGAEQRLGADWSLRVEGFVQRRDAMPYTGALALRSDGTVDAPFLANSGVARSVGFDVLIRRHLSGRFYGWLAYTFARSQQLQRPGYPWEPTPYDQPHVLTLLLGLRPSTQVEFAVRLRYASGNPVQSATGSIFSSDGGSFQPYAQPFGAVRLPSFTQVDLQVNNIWTADDFRISLYVDLQNLLGRRNAEVLVYDYRFTRPESIAGLPLTATAGVKVTW